MNLDTITPAAKAARARVLSTAIYDMILFSGEMDNGNNTGAIARRYLDGGEKLPWCAAATISWLKKAIPALDFGHEEWLSYNLMNRAEALGCWEPAGTDYQPQAGDVAIFLNIYDLAADCEWIRGHTGVVESFEPETRTANLVSANITTAIAHGIELDSISRERYGEKDFRRDEQLLTGYVNTAKLSMLYQQIGTTRHDFVQRETMKNTSSNPRAISI